MPKSQMKLLVAFKTPVILIKYLNQTFTRSLVTIQLGSMQTIFEVLQEKQQNDAKNGISS